MPRIEIELTSSRADGTWTWRAAGARQPKGALDGSILYRGAKVGDVVRAESEMGLDGIRVTSVTAPKTKRQDPDRLTLLGSGRDEPGVTGDGVAAARRGETVRSERPRGRDRSRPGGPGGPGGDRDGRRGTGPRRGEQRPGGPGSGGREQGPGLSGRERGPGSRGREGAGGPRGDRERPSHSDDRGRPSRPRGDREGSTGPRGDRDRAARGDREGAGAERGDRERQPGEGRGTDRQPGRPRRDRPAGAASGAAGPPRPRAKKLQAGRKHRDEALAALPPEQRPVAEQVLRGGMAAVRQALAEQNARAKASGDPEVRPDALLAMAEGLVPTLRAAEWRDRAEAAVADIDTVALRDLRAVVTGSDAAARDDDSRALVAQLREGLERRSNADREVWLNEIRQCLADGRLVRALRVSARPPEPAARLPEAMAQEISEATGNALAPDVATERWMALLEAAMSSPVRGVIRPRGLPAQPTADLRKAVMLATPRMPGLREVLAANARPAGPAGGRTPPPPPPPPPPASPAPPPPAPALTEVGRAPEPADDAAAANASGDDGNDAVLVEELG